MTALTESNPVTRETGATYRRRAPVVTLRARTLEIREKGRRDRLNVDYATLYEFALKLRWKQTQAEKRQAKRNKRAF